MKNLSCLAGTWCNQFGSIMNLEVDIKTGRIVGKYQTKVGRQETQATWSGVWFDVVGFTDGDLISFVVNYTSAGALCAVTGRFVTKEKSNTGSPRIEGLAQTVFDVPDQDRWRQTTTNMAVFERKL